MCRIVGIAGCNSNQLPIMEQKIIRMRDAMTHGGPDDAGIYTDKEFNVVLGHRRLSILDLSSLGHQPMRNGTGKIWISHNGEIYNFRELKTELSSLGYRFKSSTDTEVIIKAYEEWGEEAFEKFIGMFAFCLLDKNLGLLYLVRDYAGIKPLYYSIADREIIFSSEIKTFETLDKDWKENKDWKIYFLIFGHIPEPFTTLDNVYMMPKGTYIKYDLQRGSHSLNTFVNLKFRKSVCDINKATCSVRELLSRSVDRHMISDAPIGVFLSGGIDSSIIALLASEIQNENLRTLSIVFEEEEFSEEKYQKIILDKIKSNHTSYKVTEKDFINNLEDIFAAMDQPTVDGINSYFISKCAHEEGLKAVLSGLGGDELFGGYPSFKRIEKCWFLRNVPGNAKKFFGLFEYFQNDKLNKLSFLSIDNPLSFYLLFRGLFPVRTVAKILDVEKKQIHDALEKLYFKENYDMGKYNFISYLESNLYMQNQLLKDTDYMSMWHSVEVRVPFLDKEFLNFVYSIDEDIKFNKKVPKGLLIKSFEDLIPKEIISRKKQGFGFPLQKWMRDNIDYISDFAQIDGNHAIKSVLNKFQCNSLHWSRFWSLVVLSQYKR